MDINRYGVNIMSMANQKLRDLAVRIQKEGQTVGSGLLCIPPSRKWPVILTAAHVMEAFGEDDCITIQLCPQEGQSPQDCEMEYHPDDIICGSVEVGSFGMSHLDVAILPLRGALNWIHSRDPLYFAEPSEGLHLEAFSFSGNSCQENIILDAVPSRPEKSHIVSYDTESHLMTVHLEGDYIVNPTDRETEVGGWSGTILTAAGQDCITAVGVLLSIPANNGNLGRFIAADLTHIRELLPKRTVIEDRELLPCFPAEPEPESAADLSCSVWWGSVHNRMDCLWFSDQKGVILSSLLLSAANRGIFFLASGISGSFSRALNQYADQLPMPGRWIDLDFRNIDAACDMRDNVVISICDESRYSADRLCAFLQRWRGREQTQQLVIIFCFADSFTALKLCRQAVQMQNAAQHVHFLTTIDPFAAQNSDQRICAEATEFLNHWEKRLDAELEEYSPRTNAMSVVYEHLFEYPEQSAAVVQQARHYPQMLLAVFTAAATSHSGCRLMLNALGPDNLADFLDDIPQFYEDPDWLLIAWELYTLAHEDKVWERSYRYLSQTYLSLRKTRELEYIFDGGDIRDLPDAEARLTRFWLRRALPGQVAALLDAEISHVDPRYLCALLGNGEGQLHLLRELQKETMNTMLLAILLEDAPGGEYEFHKERRWQIIGR